MELRQHATAQVNRIEEYHANAWIQVNARQYNHSLLVLPTQIQSWEPIDLNALCPEHFIWLVAQQPDYYCNLGDKACMTGLIFIANSMNRLPKAPHILAYILLDCKRRVG